MLSLPPKSPGSKLSLKRLPHPTFRVMKTIIEEEDYRFVAKKFIKVFNSGALLVCGSITTFDFEFHGRAGVFTCGGNAGVDELGRLATNAVNLQKFGEHESSRVFNPGILHEDLCCFLH